MNYVRHFTVSALISIAFVAGCGGSQPPNFAPAIAQSRGTATRIERDALLYVSDASGAVYTFSYPDGSSVGSLIGLAGSPDSVCSGLTGHVFVTEYPSVIQDYARGKKLPVATLQPPGEPEECSVDSTTGNLAAGIYTYNSRPTGVAVFQHARGSATLYTDSHFSEMIACSYDDKGNLFAAGFNSARNPSGEVQLALAELPKGTSKFVDLKLKPLEIDTSNQHIEWYKGKLAIGEGARYSGQYTIYHMAISGSKTKLVRETQLSLGAHYVNADTSFSIQRGRIAVTAEGMSQYIGTSQVLLWPYPKGGVYKMSTDPFGTQHVDGVTVSFPRD